MQEFLTRIYKNLEDFFMGLSTNKKLGLIFVVTFVCASLVAILVWIGKSRYEVLYTDLNREDSKKIATLLEDNKISYQISKDGRTIKIHEDMVNKWRLQIATLGVNFSGTVGYEVFDKQSFGTTSFVQKINKQRALEGEMVKTITYISPYSYSKYSSIHRIYTRHSILKAKTKVCICCLGKVAL